MEKIKSFYTSNLPWKILSVILGFLFWIVGMNINNPVITQVVKVDLELQNLQVVDNADLTLLNYDNLSTTKVNVNVKGTRTDIESLKNNPEEIYAYIDFKPANVTDTGNVGEDLELMINVGSNDDNISVLSFSPKTVSIEFDNIISETKDVVAIQNGVEQNKYVAEDAAVVTPSTVEITGPETILNTIGQVAVSVDVYDATESFNETQNIKVYDVNGRDITDQVSLSEDVATTFVYVSQGSKIDVLEPTMTGEPAENIEIISVTYEPKFIEVVGDEVDIANLQVVAVEPIDITEIEETTEYKFDVRELLASYNLSVEEGTPYEITTKIEVSHLDTVSYRYYIDDILIQGMKENITGPDYIDLTFYGDEEAINNLSKDDVTLTLDLRDIEEGANDIQLQVVMPDGISFINDEIPTVEFFYEAPVVSETESEEIIEP